MNNELSKYARKQIKTGLLLLPEGHQLKFKRMYSHENLEATIDEVVNNIPEDKLDWAMQQVSNSIDKLQKQSNLKI